MRWDPEIRPLVPIIPLQQAVEFACRFNGRSPADVVRADYVSAIQLECVRAERPEAPERVSRFAPHWRLLFAIREYVPGKQGDDAYGFECDEPDNVLVFADGQVFTVDEFQPDES